MASNECTNEYKSKASAIETEEKKIDDKGHELMANGDISKTEMTRI